MEHSKARTLTLATGLLLGFGEVAEIFIIEVPTAAAIFALLFLGGVWLVLRDRLSGVYIIGILALTEVVFAGTYNTKGTTEWLILIAFVIVSAVATVSSAMVIIQRRRAKKTGLKRPISAA